MEDFVCLVTGATSGIGKATALALAECGVTVVVVGRRADRCLEVVEWIKQRSGNKSATYLLADLSVQDNIRALATEFLTRYKRLDVLVNNAGTISWTRQLTTDGIELSFALNHLAYFLLTNLLLDILKSSSPSRIINVSSVAHFGKSIDFHDLQSERRYKAMESYGRSKLANILFTYELSRRLEGTGISVNALHPGLVATNLPANHSIGAGWVIGSFLKGLLAIVGRSPRYAANAVVYLATSSDIAGVTGKYFANGSAVPSSDESYNRESAARLWENSLRLTDL